MQDYKQELLHVLAEAGSNGLSLKKIARHIYNSNANLFDNPDYETVYNDLAQFLSRQSKMGGGIVKKGGHRGVYSLNSQWTGYRQTMLDFNGLASKERMADEPAKPYCDKSLSLFDDF